MKFKNGEDDVMYGACVYCGQTMNVTAMVDPDATESQMNREATMHCNCAGAKEFRDRENAKHRAVEVIDEVIKDEELKAAMMTLIAPVCEQEVKSVSIDTGTGKKYAMKLNKGGLIEVKVSITSVTTRS